MRTLYRLLSLWTQARAASRGPKAYARNRARSYAHRTLTRTMRGHGL